jgi:sulfatase maturation enzyme AslB (radical SAM superfamily)
LVPKLTFKLAISDIDVNYSTARHVEFVGGEPFFDPTTFQILDLLIEHNNTDCFISLVTNGSISLSDHQLNILSKFTDLNICISIDGVGPVFEYMRWPAKWPTLLDNIEKFKKITKNISISYTISSLNVLYYQQTVDWFQSQNLRYNHNIVTYPKWISLSSTPIKIKELLSDNSFASAWVAITGKEISLDKYQHLLVKQDRAKKINIKDYLPEIWEILSDSANVGK